MKFLLGLVCGVLIALGMSGRAQVSISVFGISKHSERGYCEKNPGLAINYHLAPDLRVLAGFYKNSLCEHSNVLALPWCPIHVGTLCAGFAPILVTGYSERASFVMLPVASYEQKSFAIDAIGGIWDSKWVIGLGVRFPL